MISQIRHDDVKGQAIQLGSPLGVLKNASDFENFGRDISYSFLRKKTEKLATAVYLVTGFLSDSEPLKWQIRECSLSLLSDIVSIVNSPMSEMAHRMKSISSGIEKIVSLFEIASAAGFISGMNLAVLKEEYRSLAEIIENRKIGRPEGGYVFSREFFSAPEPVAPMMSEKENFRRDDFSKERQKTTVEKDTLTTPFVRKEYPIETREENLSVPTMQSNPPDMFTKNILPKKPEKSSRRGTILELIKDKGESAEVSIKDVVGHFSDCGEKTIQRELTALVDEGVLKKTGERRWSRYSLSVQ